MKSSDMRAKARAIFGSAIAEPMPKQPNGAKALQQRANARPIPTYKVGGVVKSTPPGPTAAERAEARRQNESLKKAKVTPKEGKVIGSANRSEGSMYKKGGKVQKKAVGGVADPYGGMPAPLQQADMSGISTYPGSTGQVGGAAEYTAAGPRQLQQQISNPNAMAPAYKKGGKIVKKAVGGAMGVSAPSARQPVAVKPPTARRVAADELRAMQQARLAAKQKPLRQEVNPSRPAGATRGPIKILTGPKREQMPIQAQKPAPMVEDKAAEQRRLADIIASERSPGAMKKGGKAKDGLAVMIAIGKPMKGMKKPVKKALGGLGKFPSATGKGLSSAPSQGYYSGLTGREQHGIKRAEKTVAPRMGSPVKKALGGKIDAKLSRAITGAKADMARMDPTNVRTLTRGGLGKSMGVFAGRSVAPERMGSPVKRAVGGAGKTRKGMCK